MVIDVQINKKARNPAYAVKIDFGEFGAWARFDVDQIRGEI